jgi:hypothetical protein
VIFIETPIFTRQALDLLDDEGLAQLQRTLLLRPASGRIMEGTGGIRKIRVAVKGHGKRGGARVIYYHFVNASQIALLMIYSKSDQADLTNQQCLALSQIIERWSNA